MKWLLIATVFFWLVGFGTYWPIRDSHNDGDIGTGMLVMLAWLVAAVLSVAYVFASLWFHKLW